MGADLAVKVRCGWGSTSLPAKGKGACREAGSGGSRFLYDVLRAAFQYLGDRKHPFRGAAHAVTDDCPDATKSHLDLFHQAGHHPQRLRD